MKMTIIAALSLYSLSSFACWRMKATLSSGADEVTINQKIDHDKTYTFSKGKHIFHVKVPSRFEAPTGKTGQLIELVAQEKNGLTLSTPVNGKILVLEDKEATMTIEDNETNKLTTFKVVLNQI